MTRWQSVLSSAGCGAACTLLGLSARAVAPARLSYQAPEGCPAEEGFVAAVRSRGVSFDSSFARERWLKVAIERDAAGFSGALQVQEGEQISERREVHGASCAEVSDALAVVTAIALSADGNAAETNPAAERAELPSARSPAAHAAATAAPVLAATPVAATGARERSVQVATTSDSLDMPAGKLGFGFVRGYTLSAGAALGVIPNLALPRVDFAISATNLVKTPGDTDYLLPGGLRVRWSFLGVATKRSAEFSTRIWALKAGLGTCGPLIFDPEGLTLQICSEIAAGAMSLETKDAAGNSTQSKVVGIGTGSVELDSQYHLGSSVHVQLRAGGEMWLSKATAERPDGSQLFHSSTFNAYVLAGLGLRF